MNKKYLSVFLLFLRHSAWKVLLTAALAVAVQVGVFAFFLPDPTAYSLEAALYACRTPLKLSLLVVFLLIFIALDPGSEKGKVRTRYTIDRLGLTLGEILSLQALYNLLALLLFWAAEAAAILGIFLVYEQAGGLVTSQSFYLVCWQSEFVHAFLPLEDWTRWLCNLAVALAFAVILATSDAQERAGNRPIAILFLIGVLVTSFIHSVNQPTIDAIVGVVSLALAGFSLHNALTLLPKEDEPHEEAD